MRKGEATREHIIKQAAGLFNSNGFSGAPISELMKITGLKKGGIYNHFKNKEEILAEAFNYSIRLLLNKLEAVTTGAETPGKKLRSIIEFYRDYPLNPVIKGGCPVLNAIVYSDNTNRLLKMQVRKVIDELINRIKHMIKDGVELGEFKQDVDPQKIAVLIFTTIEGGVALSRNYDDNKYMETVIDYLINYIKSLS